MPGATKRRTRNSSSGVDQLIPSNNVSTRGDVSLPAMKRKKTSEDIDKENMVNDQSLLVECLLKAGLVVKEGEEQNILKEDQAMFLKKFSKDICSEIEYPENIDNMFNTLSAWLEDETFLIKCLSPTATSVKCNSARSSQQDSLLKLLLNTKDFQPKLLGLLLEKLAEISLMQEGKEMMRSQQNTIPRLILSAVRFLNIVDGEGLAEKMVEILQASSKYQQVEVISALPEIIPDQQHPVLAKHLQEMLDERQPLTSTILDCFSNLNLNTEIISDLQSSVLKKLPSYNLSDLPTVLDFILSTCTKADSSVVVQDLRDGLNLTARLRPSQRPEPGSFKKREMENCKSTDCIILDKLNIAMATEKWMGDAWLSAVESVRDVSEQKPLDLLVLILLRKNPQRKKVVESIMRNKIRGGMFTEQLVITTFEQHVAALKQYMLAVIAMAEVLLESSEGVVINFAKEMYSAAFSKLGNFCHQEIVSDMVSKVGSGGAIAEGAIKVLDNLSEHHGEILARYGLFVLCVLDHMEGMSLGQVRKIISILARLAWRAGAQESGGVIQDDLIIVVKKQLNSSNLILKRMGVVGVVACVKAMVRAVSTESELQEDLGVPVAESSRNSSVGLGGQLGEAMDLLEIAEMRTRNFPDVAGLFLDEMSNMISDSETLSKKFMEDVNLKFAEVFQAEFIEDAHERNNNEFTITSTLEMMLDEDIEDSDGPPISLSLAPKVMKVLGVQSKTGELVPVRGSELSLLARLVPTFRLLSKVVSKKCGGDLEEIDALVGCGVWMFPDDVTENIGVLSAVEKNAVCGTLFYVTNWCLELINSFSTLEGEEIKKKVLVRLKQVLKLKELISVILGHNPMFRPPTALFCEDTSDWCPVQTQDGKKGKKGEKGKKGKGKKSKPKVTETMMNATLNLNTQRTQALASQQQPANNAEVDSMNGRQKVDIQHYRPFFRELDLSSLAVMSYQPTTTETEPSEEEEFAEPKFRPPELLFILKDLQAKLDKSLVCGKKRGFPGKSNSLSMCGFTNLSLLSPVQVVETVSKYLKQIFTHLDEISSYFQRLISLHDGVVDSMNMFTPQAMVFSQCIKVGFQVVTTFFSWSGFQSASCSNILTSSLYQLVSRLADINLNSSLNTLINTATSYLKRFTTSIMSIDVAAAHLVLISTLADLGSESGKARVKETVASVAKEYLARDWRDATGEKDKGAEFNKQVEKLLLVFLSNSKDVLSELEILCKDGLGPVIASKDGFSEEFPVITRANLGAVYKVMMATLVTEIRKLTFGVTKDPDIQFSTWSRAMEIFVNMTTSLKTWCNRALLSAILKHSRHFIDHFIRHGMPLLERQFRKKRVHCVELIKNLQLATRYLQSVCNHSKISQDISLSNSVPLLKKSLEVLVFRAKAMLAANNCLDAFVLGNLKNRDLQGEEILSQASTEDDDEEEGEEEEDGDSDVELIGDEEGEQEEVVAADSAMSIEV